MDSISGDTLRKAADSLDCLRTSDEVHTVTLTLDGRTGGCEVTVASMTDSDIVFLVRG